jgi:hypothetical protein
VNNLGSILALTFIILLPLYYFAMPLNYASKKNLSLTKERMAVALKEGNNSFYPLTFDLEFYKEHPAVIPMWSKISIPYADFKGIMQAHELWPADGSNVKWSSILPKWGLGEFRLEKHGKENSKWVNFHPEANKCKIDAAFHPSGEASNRSIFKLPSQDDAGWVFLEDGKRRSESTTDSHKPSKQPKCSSSSLDSLDHSSSSSSLPSSASTLDRPEAQSEATTPVAHTDVFSSSMLINESLLCELESGRDMSLSEESQVGRLLKAVARPEPDCSDVKTVSISARASKNKKSAKWLFLAHSEVEDEKASPTVLKKRASVIDWAAGFIKASQNAFSKLIRKKPTAFKGAVLKSKITKVVLSVADSLHFKSLFRLSNTSMRLFKKESRALDLNFSFAPEPQMRAAIEAEHVEATYYTGVPLAGSNGPIKSLIYAANISDIICRDYDRLVASGELHVWPLACNVGQEEARTVILSNDWGGSCEKFTVHPIDTLRPNSAALQSIFCSAEAERVDEQTKKISGCYENFRIELSKVHGLGDLDKNVMVQVGQRHALIPKHTVPATWTYVEVDSMDEFYSTKYAGPNGDPIERIALRAALPPGCAMLACRGGECLGISCGSASFPFRRPVPVDKDKAPSPSIWPLRVVVSADLLSLCNLVGHPGQATCNCQWGRNEASGFKLAASDPLTYPCPLRTKDSEAEDLAAFKAKPGKDPRPVNGVSAEPLFPFKDFLHVFPPPLHVFLGTVNFELGQIKKVSQCASHRLVAAHCCTLYLGNIGV